MTHPRLLEINQYWASRLNCSLQAFEEHGTTICARELSKQKYPRIIVTRTSNQAIVQAPPEQITLLKDSLNTSVVVTASDVIAAVEKEHDIEFGWRDFIWYFPSNVYEAPFDARVRLLKASDRDALNYLLNLCTEEERELANVSIEQDIPLGLFENNCLLAVGSFIFDGDLIADVGVITHPQYRQCGLGKAVVTELVRKRIENGRIVQYTTQEINTGSKRLAEAIGFWLYAIEEDLYLV